MAQIPLPEHMRLVALEESVILEVIRDLMPGNCQLPAAISLATRNELVTIAQAALRPGAFERLMRVLAEVDATLSGTVIIRYPEPVYVNTCRSMEAEAIADSHLLEGAGSLWSAVREVVRSLTFEADGRVIASGRSLQLGLYQKGGLVGMHRHTAAHRAACRLINAAVLTSHSTHRWTTLTIGYNNATLPHLDRGNSEDPEHLSLLIGVTHHRGGELWVQGSEGTHYMDTDQGILPGTLLQTSAQAVLFDGRGRMHSTMPWSDGDRCQHTPQCFERQSLFQARSTGQPTGTAASSADGLNNLELTAVAPAENTERHDGAILVESSSSEDSAGEEEVATGSNCEMQFSERDLDLEALD
eukprot:s5198_g4.t1